jgi:molybdopterin converting factor small subunit
MKIKMLMLVALLAVLPIQAEAVKKCTDSGLPDTLVVITHLAVLKKRFYNSSPAVKDFLVKTMLLEKMAEQRIPSLDFSLKLKLAYIKYYCDNPHLTDEARKTIQDSYSEIVTNLLAENPELAEIFIRNEKEKDAELGIHEVRVWVEGRGPVVILVGKTSTLKDGDRIQMLPSAEKD